MQEGGTFVADTGGPAFAAAVARYQAGEFGAAALLFGAILAHAPDHADSRRMRGLSLTRAGRAAEGLGDLMKARRLAATDPLSHLHYGIGLQEAGRPARAVALFRRATVMMPDSPAPWINLGSALLVLDHAKAARAAARRAVARAPRDADAVYVFGLAELAEGNLEAAHGAFAEAVRLRPRFAEAWINLVLVLTRAGRIGFALKAIERGLAACPDCGTLTAASAGFNVLAGDQETALAQLRAVLDSDPGCVAARLNLANALLLDDEARKALGLLSGAAPSGRDGAHWLAHRAMALLMLGRTTEAERDLDAIAPPYGDAEILVLWRRICLARNAGRDAEAAAMAERMASLAACEGAGVFEHRVIAHFDLARFRSERNEPREAFRHWRSGHALLARIQPFSREGCAAFFDATVRAYDAARLRDGPVAGNHDFAPVFIVGLPRSGTSLLEQILAAHPLVHGAGERPAVHQLFTRLAKGGALDPASPPAVAELGAGILTHEAETFLARLHEVAPEARLVIDKMPGNALHLGFTATLLPKARVILCHRDPRDIGLSIFQLRFFGNHPYAHDLADLGWYIAAHERLMAHWLAVLPLPILTVNLSDWVEDFPGTLGRVLGFLELPHDAACERFYEQKRRVRTASARQVRQPVSARGIGRWRAFAEELAPMIAELEAAGCLAADT